MPGTSSLSIEPDAHCSPLRKVRRQQLDGDAASESPVDCAIDLAHATTRNMPEDFVGTQTCSGGKRHPFRSVDRRQLDRRMFAEASGGVVSRQERQYFCTQATVAGAQPRQYRRAFRRRLSQYLLEDLLDALPVRHLGAFRHWYSSTA